MSKPTMEILSAEECTELLRQVPVGRIAITVGALPVILPINFAVVDDAIVFRTISGTKLAAATSNAVVAFEVDSYEDDGRSGWSVMVQGMATEVTDPAGLERARAASLDSWALDGDAGHVVQIELHVLSGRRFTTQSGSISDPEGSGIP
jgi:nitroimidazol reductase NimA-like FMN-containing flavoprotein (pyridoxamine 5'-phosphate oxidase superfamily)